MLKHRCPWCGERLSTYFAPNTLIGALYRSKEPQTCPKCRKPYESYKSKKELKPIQTVLVILGLVAFMCFWGLVQIMLEKIMSKLSLALQICIIIAVIFLVISSFIGVFQIPFERCYTKKERKENIFISKKKATVTVRWHNKKNSRLWNPKIQVQAGEIFPAYFKDQAGNLISSGLCVVLEEIKWTGKRQCNCEISFVLDDVPAEKYLQLNNQFYLYYYDRQIAEGNIL